MFIPVRNEVEIVYYYQLNIMCVCVCVGGGGGWRKQLFFAFVFHQVNTRYVT